MNALPVLRVTACLLASALACPSVAQAGGSVPSALTKVRQRTLDVVWSSYPRLTKGCGSGNYDSKTQAVLYPAGKSNELYVVESGVYSYFAVSAGQPILRWCGTLVGADGQTVARLGTNSFAGYAQKGSGLSTPARYTNQRGRLPAYKGNLDLYMVLGGQASRGLVDSAGKLVCVQPIKQEMGLSKPVLSEPVRCSS